MARTASTHLQHHPHPGRAALRAAKQRQANRNEALASHGGSHVLGVGAPGGAVPLRWAWAGGGALVFSWCLARWLLISEGGM